MPCEYLYRSQFANCHAYTKCKHLRFAALSHSLCGSLNRSDIDAYCNLICSGMHCFCSFLVRPFSCVADLRALPSASRFFFFSLIYFIFALCEASLQHKFVRHFLSSPILPNSQAAARSSERKENHQLQVIHMLVSNAYAPIYTHSSPNRLARSQNGLTVFPKLKVNKIIC